jgi:hypothetical protein
LVHEYEGALPPLVGVAVKVTGVPAQIAPAGSAAISTAGNRIGIIDIVIALLVAVVGLTHVALLVSIQVTMSLLFKPVLLNVVEEPSCIETPFTSKL